MRLRLLLAAVLAQVATCAGAQDGVLIDLGAGVHRIQAEVASTARERAVGLMHRAALPPNRGMLFVFPDAQRHCMWMRNTFVPLSVAFLDAEGHILNIEDMQPQTETNHCAAQPARFALEMAQGWFAARGLAPGARIRGVQRAPSPQ